MNDKAFFIVKRRSNCQRCGGTQFTFNPIHELMRLELSETLDGWGNVMMIHREEWAEKRGYTKEETEEFTPCNHCDNGVIESEIELIDALEMLDLVKSDVFETTREIKLPECVIQSFNNIEARLGKLDCLFTTPGKIEFTPKEHPLMTLTLKTARESFLQHLAITEKLFPTDRKRQIKAAEERTLRDFPDFSLEGDYGLKQQDVERY